MSLRPAQNSSRKRRPWLLPFAALIVLSAANPARADITVTAQSVSSSDGALDVFLTNTGPSAVNIAAFSFEVNVSSSQVTFTDATYHTTTNPYIFASNSLYGPDILTNISNGGQTLLAGDVTSDSSNVSVGSGDTVGLGQVLFTTSGTLTSDATVSFTAYPSTSLADASGNNVVIDTFTNGTISPGAIVPVPEPSTLTIVVVAGAFSLLGYRFARKRSG